MHLIDTHIHLNFPQFHPDLEAVVDRMKTAGVSQAINIGTSAQTSQESIVLAERFSWLYAAVGIHPHDALELDAQIDVIKTLAKHPRVVAIGEIGLDYFRNEVPAEIQIKAFIAQLDIAIKAEKPIILHCRDAYAQTIAVLQDNYIAKVGSRLPGVIHSFTGTANYAQQFLKLGFYVGINNIVAYPSSTSLQEAVKMIPLEKILIETDSPYLPPAHLRGSRCEPAFVVEVARKIAELKDVPLKQVVDTTTANAKLLFKLTND